MLYPKAKILGEFRALPLDLYGIMTYNIYVGGRGRWVVVALVFVLGWLVVLELVVTAVLFRKGL